MRRVDYLSPPPRAALVSFVDEMETARRTSGRAGIHPRWPDSKPCSEPLRRLLPLWSLQCYLEGSSPMGLTSLSSTALWEPQASQYHV